MIFYDNFTNFFSGGQIFVPGQLIWESSAHAGCCPDCELVSDSVQPVRIVDVDDNVDETRHPPDSDPAGESSPGGLSAVRKACFCSIVGIVDDDAGRFPPLVHHPCGIHIGKVRIPRRLLAS